MKILIKLIINSILLITFNANAIISNAVEPVKYFVNHSLELEGIKSKLSLYGKANIVGISGIGKTQISRMYAYTNRNKYNLIWFFDCSTDLDSQYALLASEINRHTNQEFKLSENVLSAKNSVIKYLTSKKNWLLIFDNIKIKENHKINDITLLEHNGNIIINSQDEEGLIDSINVSYLNNDDTIRLLNMLLKRDVNFKNNLSSAFKGYPIFITNAAIFLDKNKHLNLEEYNKILNHSENKMKNHINLVINELKKSTKDLLYKISLINNQRFSKELLKTISEEKTFIEDLQELIRFGIISTVTSSDVSNKLKFEMHDMVRDLLILNMKNSDKIINLEKILNSINVLFPRNISDRYSIFREDDTLINNLEILLNNAEIYSVNKNKIMELRKNLMSFYLNSLDYHNCQKMMDWLLKNKKNMKSTIALSTEKDKINYVEYIIDIAVYEDFAKSDYKNSIKFLEEAKEIIKDIKGYNDVKFTLFAQLSQTYAFRGDIENAKKNIEITKKIIDNSDVKLDLGLYWFIKSKISLLEGKYDSAINSIEENIKTESHLSQGTFTAPTYILQSEILNYMGIFEKSYNIINNILEQELKNNNEDHEIIARILVQLSRSELGLGKIKESLDYAEKSVSIFINHEMATNHFELINSHNIDLAEAYVAQAEALAAMNKLEDAIKSVAIADVIFYNVYGKNMYNLDNISYMYYKACIVSNNANDKNSFDRFKNKLTNSSRNNDTRIIELEKLLK